MLVVMVNVGVGAHGIRPDEAPQCLSRGYKGETMDRPQRDFQPSYAQRSLATPLNLSQTVEGCTLTIKQGYADGHGIELVASFSADPDNEFTSYRTKLDDDVGNDYTSGGHSIGMGDAGLSFKLPEATPLPATLNLHLEVKVSPGHRFSHSDYLPPRSEYPSSPFTFDFSIPYFPARNVEVNQTVLSEANSMTLERLSVTPSGVQAYLRLPRPADHTPYMIIQAWVMLQTPDEPSPFSYRSMAYALYGKEDATGTISDHYFDDVPLYRQSGEWTLRVESVQYRDISQPVILPGEDSKPIEAEGLPTKRNVRAWGQWVPNGQPIPTFPGHTAIPGEWVFSFIVPPPEPLACLWPTPPHSNNTIVCSQSPKHIVARDQLAYGSVAIAQSLGKGDRVGPVIAFDDGKLVKI
jgi:hypothetical protein